MTSCKQLIWYQSPLQSNEVKDRIYAKHNGVLWRSIPHRGRVAVQCWTVCHAGQQGWLPRTSSQFGAGISDYKVILQSHETASAEDSMT